MSIKSSSGKWGLVFLVWVIIVVPVIVTIWFFKFRSHEKLEETTSSQSQYKHQVRMISDAFSGYCIFRSDEFKKELKNHGIKFLYSDDSADYKARLDALEAGKADVAPFPVNSLIEMCEKSNASPATIVLFIDETKGADAIVAYKTSIKSLDDLNQSDVRFVLTPGSPSEYLARVVKADLDMSNLPGKWITDADGAEEVYEKFRKASKSKPAAYVLWEPYVSKALKDKDAHVVFGSDKIRGHIVDSLVVRRKFLNDNPEVVKTFVESYLKVNYKFSEGDKLVELIRDDAKATGEKLSADEARNIASGIQWKNTLENYAHFRLLSRQESQGLEDVEDIIEKITRVLIVTGSISASRIDAHTLFYNRILEELQTSGFHPGQKLGIVSGGGAALKEIRGDSKLPALSDAEWDKLIGVGRMRIQNLSFRRGTAELNVQSRRNLEELASKLKSMPEYYLRVVGHARAEGDIDANVQLANDRANVASQYLTQRQGIARNRIKAVAATPSGANGSAQSVTFQLMQRSY